VESPPMNHLHQVIINGRQSAKFKYLINNNLSRMDWLRNANSNACN
jgi:hypothetical protein